MSRRMNDGAKTGLKQDKYRNSRFEFEDQHSYYRNQGVSRKTPNTIGGVYEENRGHRSADENLSAQWEESPFEDGKLYNWNHRTGWDNHFRDYDEEPNRNRGGAIRNTDISYRGRGPKGYKRNDDAIREDVCEMLYASPDVDATDIDVSVKEGVVFLEGTVENRRSKRMAEYEVETVSGVVDVQNMLSFKQNNQGLH